MFFIPAKIEVFSCILFSFSSCIAQIRERASNSVFCFILSCSYFLCFSMIF
ncbi:MAG: hypothetical protein LBC61_01975 [Candidatus Peribacteria bacterium]|nr:hypothetical protein [Candidatus Peribacteria bacterium]